jgi:hypothetical protein
MSKEGNYLYPSASDSDLLSDYAASSWGGNVSISRFEAIPKVPFQRTLQESFSLFSSSSRASSSHQDPMTELIRTKRQLIQSKVSELESMNNELVSGAKSGKSESGHLFDLQRRIRETEAEIQALEADLDRRTRLEALNSGEEGDKAALFDLTNSKYWTDFNKSFWHPSSLNMLSSLTDTSPYDIYSRDAILPEELELFMDRMRSAFEYCDQVEGIQIFVDAATTYGAISSAIMEETRDIFGKMRTISFPLFTSGGASIGQLPIDTSRIRAINRSLTLSSLSNWSSLVVPIDTNFWTQNSFSSATGLQTDNWYHTSALVASAIDSMTLPTRSIADGVNWRQFIENLVCVSPSQNFGLLSTCHPLPLSCHNGLSRQFFGYDIFANPELMTNEERAAASSKRILPHASWMTPMIPFSNSGKTSMNAMEDTSMGVALPWSESVVMRGVSREFAKNPASDDQYYAPHILYHLLKRYSVRSRYFAAWEAGSALPIAYPRIFDSNLNLDLHSLPSLTHLQNSSRIADYLHITTQGLSVDDARRYPTLNFEVENVLAAQDRLLSLEEDYGA